MSQFLLCALAILCAVFDFAEDSAWVVVEGKVYDVTGFLDDVSSKLSYLSPR